MTEEKLEQILALLKSINTKLAARNIVEELKTEETEEVLMDLTEVTVIAMTEKAMLVTKKGYQKWLPFSTIEGGNVNINEGDFLTDIVLTEKASKWIPNKSWDKLKVVKK